MSTKTNFILNELKVTRKVDTGLQLKCSDCFRSRFVLLQKPKNARLKDGVGALKVVFYAPYVQLREPTFHRALLHLYHGNTSHFPSSTAEQKGTRGSDLEHQSNRPTSFVHKHNLSLQPHVPVIIVELHSSTQRLDAAPDTNAVLHVTISTESKHQDSYPRFLLLSQP